MPKKQSKSTKGKEAKSHKILLVASLIVNAVLIIGIIVTCAVFKSGKMDLALLNHSVDRYCHSREFANQMMDSRKTAKEKKEWLAARDFICAQNGAGEYFVDGLNRYIDDSDPDE